MLGDLADYAYTTSATYDALGQVVESALPAVGGVPAETVVTGYRLSGTPETLTVSSAGVSTELVSSTAYDGVGRLVSRTYGNDVVREMAWDDVTGALEGLSATFDAGAHTVQDVSFVRDGAQRITAASDQVTASVGYRTVTRMTGRTGLLRRGRSPGRV